MLTTTFENEKETCNDIYEVLWHSIVFRSLIECVFPELICEFSLENPKKREDRENFLSKTKNTQKILDYFSQQDKWLLFEEVLLWLYEKHKEALNPNEQQKNMLWIAIKAIKEYISILNNETTNTSNLALTKKSDTIVGWLKKKFLKIIAEQLIINKSKDSTERTIISSLEWFTATDSSSEWKTEELFGKKISKVWWIYIDVETRTPIIIEWRYTIINKFPRYNQITVVIYDTHTEEEMTVLLTSNFEIAKDEEWSIIRENVNNIKKDFFGKEYFKHLVTTKHWDNWKMDHCKFLTKSWQSLKDNTSWRIIEHLVIYNFWCYIATVIDNWNSKKIILNKNLEEVTWLKKLWINFSRFMMN